MAFLSCREDLYCQYNLHLPSRKVDFDDITSEQKLWRLLSKEIILRDSTFLQKRVILDWEHGSGFFTCVYYINIEKANNFFLCHTNFMIFSVPLTFTFTKIQFHFYRTLEVHILQKFRLVRLFF